MWVFAPGRVNLIGDHTDYTGGLCLPMAVDLGTTVTGRRTGDEVRLTSAELAGEAVVPLAVDPGTGVSGRRTGDEVRLPSADVAGGAVVSVAAGDPSPVEPPWARYVAGVVSVIRPARGFAGRLTTTLPVGAGLSSSAALEVAVALALGFEGTALELALACQRAEHAASGVPCGIMDQLSSAAGVEGHALLIDCAALTVSPVPVPDDAEIVVVDSGQRRRLAASAYGERRRSCEAAEASIGPLATADLDAVEGITDAGLRARARHVVTENARVRAFAAALGRGDLAKCGALMTASHKSLRCDFQVSTPVVDQLVARLMAAPGVLGARLTGAGFGGCVVALARPGALEIGWRVRPAGGARVIVDDA
jgi:galactokinase